MHPNGNNFTGQNARGYCSDSGAPQWQAQAQEQQFRQAQQFPMVDAAQLVADMMKFVFKFRAKLMIPGD